MEERTPHPLANDERHEKVYIDCHPTHPHVSIQNALEAYTVLLAAVLHSTTPADFFFTQTLHLTCCDGNQQS